VLLTVLINDDVRLPRNSDVEVRSVSAIGEQYLDFLPRFGGGPTFRAGDTVPESDVRMPVAITDVLSGANALAATLPRDDLNTTTAELSRAFAGTSGDWRRVLDATPPLLQTAHDNLAATQQLIGDLQPVLSTQDNLGTDTRNALSNLAKFTAALQAADGSLRGTIEKTPHLTRPLEDVVRRVRDPLPQFIESLTKVGDVAKTYDPNIRHIFVVLPAMLNYIQSALYNTPVPGSLRIYLRAQADDPPPCTQGFAGASQRNPDDLRPVEPFVNVGCKVPRNSPLAVRGTHNAPCPNNPSQGSMTASGCGLTFQSARDNAKSLDLAMATIMDTARKSPISQSQPEGAPPPDAAAQVETTSPDAALPRPNGQR
jgi:phospholipid/cholesterol/gamma-HCH transport system substrate-binding protein